MSRDRSLRPELAAIVGERVGAFRRCEALRCDYTVSQIRTHLESGDWARLQEGVYVQRNVLDHAVRVSDRENVLRAEALVLAIDGSVMSHGSAIRRYGMQHLNDIGDRPQATWPRQPSRSQWADDKVNIRRAGLPAEHVLDIGGVSVTTPARTVADAARDFGFASGVVVGDSALAQRLITRVELEKVLTTMAGWPGVRQARRIADCIDARAENPLESVAHAVWYEGGLPKPELQVWVFDTDGFIGIVDGLWLDSLVGYEVDGAVKYGGIGDANVLLREKLRQERLETAGLVIRRFGWDQLWRTPELCRERIRSSFPSAARRPPPRVRLYIGDPDTSAPDPLTMGGIGFVDPAELGLQLAYDRLTQY